jgi:predicted nucleic acid-binding protein
VSLVLDASMTIAWLFTNERSAAAQVILRRVAADGAWVPSLWRLEIANVLRNAVRRQRCDEAYADRSLRRLDRLPITVDSETDLNAWGATRQLSKTHNLTPYDAAYLELAIRRKQPLASRDAALIDAAKDAGVEVLDG